MKKIFLIVCLIIGINGLAQQEHSGGIETATGFKLSDPQPIDDRYVVADSASLNSLPNKYEGLVSYAKAEDALFTYNGSTWNRVGNGSVGTTPNLTQVLTEGNKTTLDLVTTGEITANIVNTPTIDMRDSYSYIGTTDGEIEDDGGVLYLKHSYSIDLDAPVLKLKGMNFPLTAGTNGQVLTTDGTNMNWTTPSSEGETIYIELTKTQLDTAIANSELVPGTLYKITEVETWMKQGDTTKAIYLHAISANELEKKGTGEFYVPKYDQGVAGYGIWSGELWQKTSGTMGTEPEYDIDDVVIWGGKHWKNLTGDYGTFINHYELDGTNWEEITVNDTDYNVRTNIVEYDYSNDMITYRKDDVGNEISTSYRNWEYLEKNAFNYDPLSDSNYNPTKIFQWGNEYEYDYDSFAGVGFNIVENGAFECVNQRGFIYNNTINIGLIYNNTINGGRIYNNTINIGSIYNNTFENNGSIHNNTLNNGSIENNILNIGFINYNNLDSGHIYNNTLENNGHIFYNTLKINGRIYNNTINIGIINYNTLDRGSIQNNTLNNGGINNNTINIGYIQNNTLENNGHIENNTLESFGFIQNNTIENNGRIYNNTINGGRIRLGLSNPINNKQLQYLTVNTGDIGKSSGIDLSSATLVYQTYERIVFQDSTGTTKIRYYDGNGNLVVADLTD